VRPRSATIVEEGGSYVSNYYSVKPAGDLETNPLIHLKGDRSTAKNMSVLVCLPETYNNIGGTVLMSGEHSGAEIVARTVNHGGTVVQTGLLIGAAKDARAHVDCSGLMLSDSGTIEAVPGLRSMHPEARMSHEAAIGRIDMGEVHYLQSKGLDEMQATALIVRGFLDIGQELEGFAPELKRTIQEISELSGHGED
jgi:Fe-S cluster assembly scaffold protein SufB